MAGCIFAMEFFLSSDSSLVDVVAFLSTMMSDEVEREDKNMVECCNGGPSQFYQGPTMGANYNC